MRRMALVVVALAATAQDAVAIEFDPFKWREAGIEAAPSKRAFSRSGEVMFTHRGTRWWVEPETGNRAPHAYGRHGDWEIHLLWDGLGAPVATTSTSSPSKNMARELDLSYGCAITDKTGWRIYVSVGEPPSWKPPGFGHTRGMASGTYTLRIDNGPLRRVEMKQGISDADSAEAGISWVDLESPRDNMWLTERVRAGRILRALTRVRVQEARGGAVSTWPHHRGVFSLKGSRRALDIAKAHCARPARTM